MAKNNLPIKSPESSNIKVRCKRIDICRNAQFDEIDLISVFHKGISTLSNDI